MCGITGIISLEPRQFDTELLKRMIYRLRHRGPDETGLYIDKYVALGHTRLSIIDLSTGQQPLTNEDESLWIVFNGEIFNYVELNEYLIKKGHKFRTRSDTETILHSYEEWGEDCVNHFNGQFAFVIWDSKQKVAFLARDRVGILPLYYFFDPNRRVLYFASEVKSIFALPEIEPQLDSRGVAQCFTFWAPIAPSTLFKNIYQLPPGSILVFKDGEIKTKKYWYPLFPPTTEEFKGSIDEATEILKEKLLKASAIRLRADVPVGAYLSGGIDSSLITGILVKYSDVKLETFSVRFTDQEFDEGKYQREVVEYLGTTHHEIECDYKDIANVFIDVIRHAEQPILRTAPAPLFILSLLVRNRGYKVVLTGEGSDEFLAGYDIFRETVTRYFVAKDPESKYRSFIFNRLYPWMVRSPTQAPQFAKAFFSKGLEFIDKPRFSHLTRWLTTQKLLSFLSNSIKEEVTKFDPILEYEESLPQQFYLWHHLNKAQYIEIETLLGSYLLSAQGDRMLMAHSVEGRFPYLDHEFMEFANTLPPHYKLYCLDEKHILKKVAQELIPESILKRPKQPYRAPDASSFFYKGAPDYISEMLSERYIKEVGIFDFRPVSKLIEKARKVEGRGMSNTDNMAIVGILSTQILYYLLSTTWREENPPSYYSIDRVIQKL